MSGAAESASRMAEEGAAAPAADQSRIDAFTAVLRAADETGVHASLVSVHATDDIRVWLRPNAAQCWLDASESDVREFLRRLGAGDVAAEQDHSWGVYTASAVIGDRVWQVEVHGDAPDRPDVPEGVVVATWEALAPDCLDCADQAPCPAHRAEATAIAAATLKATGGPR